MLPLGSMAPCAVLVASSGYVDCADMCKGAVLASNQVHAALSLGWPFGVTAAVSNEAHCGSDHCCKGLRQLMIQTNMRMNEAIYVRMSLVRLVWPTTSEPRCMFGSG